MFSGLFLAAFVHAQGPPKKREDEQKQTQKKAEKEQEPPEEDADLQPKVYSFNPLEASKNLNIGNYYFKVGKYDSAAKRFREATRWNPGYADAYLRLGEACEKLKDQAGAQEAYSKYLELAPDAKNAAQIRKKLHGKS